ncbi:MAG: MFS transporter [Firmicutes bacterium]|nr:MFS transporter [Bacillota bacterium]
MAKNDQKILKDAYTYGIGFIGQGASYIFMSTYFVLFLTNDVMLSSTVAAAISSVAMFFEVFMGMLVGNISDSCTSKMGRRRPFMLAAGIAILPILTLLFRTVGFGGPMRIIYYLVFAMMFRAVFSTFEIPNQAFGAELASGYDDRTKLRTVTRAISIAGNGVGYLLPLWILALFKDNAEGGWWLTGILVGVITCLGWTLSSVLNRGKGVVLSKEDVQKKGHRLGEILRNYLELVRLKTGTLGVMYKTAFTIALALFNVATIYYLKYSAHLDNKYMSYMYIVTITVFMVVTPIINRMALRFGKVKQQMISLGSTGVIGLIVYFLGAGTIWGTILYMAFFAFTQTGFWQISSAIFYDIIEVDEWVNGKRREGDLMSMISVLGTLISAIMVQIFGLILDASGFDAALETQAASVAPILNVTFILIPSVALLLGTLALNVFPINKVTFGSIKAALEARRNGEDYSEYMDDVNRIVGKQDRK